MNREYLEIEEGGFERWEETEMFHVKVAAIRKEVIEKYATNLSAEKNWLKRFLLKQKIQTEIRRKRNDISSHYNLHFAVE